MYYATQPGEGVEFVAEVIHALRGAVAEVRRRVWSGSAHHKITENLQYVQLFLHLFINNSLVI